jgi:hypothetical protein
MPATLLLLLLEEIGVAPTAPLVGPLVGNAAAIVNVEGFVVDLSLVESLDNVDVNGGKTVLAADGTMETHSGMSDTI